MVKVHAGLSECTMQLETYEARCSRRYVSMEVPSCRHRTEAWAYAVWGNMAQQPLRVFLPEQDEEPTLIAENNLSANFNEAICGQSIVDAGDIF